MSDEALRTLERRWRESGAIEDEAALLLERARRGDLTPERLELAAYCHHPAAVFARGGASPSEGEELESWLRGLTERGRPAFRLAAVLVARAVLKNARASSSSGELPADVGAAAREWVHCPCQEHLELALEAGSIAVRGTPLEEMGWCAAAAAAPLESGPMLLARVIHRVEAGTPDLMTQLRSALSAWALDRTT